jgi:DNA-directed RNA polymerase subunit H (RpoH/RPB5)
MNSEQFIKDLNYHFEVTQELLALSEREGKALRQPDAASLFEFYQTRKNLLPRFTESLEAVRKHRANWQRMSLDERAEHPQAPALMRRLQDLTMKVIVLDRENEQALLRRGLVPPRELPSINRQRPHFVADLYSRAGR